MTVGEAAVAVAAAAAVAAAVAVAAAAGQQWRLQQQQQQQQACQWTADVGSSCTGGSLDCLSSEWLKTRPQRAASSIDWRDPGGAAWPA